MIGARRIASLALSGLVVAGLAAGSSAGASAPATHVKAGSQWTMITGPVTYCGLLTFTSHHTFSDNHASSGKWSGKQALRLHWTTGTYAGQRFAGTYATSDGEYIGTLDFQGSSLHALLEPGNDPCPV
jgi:hypothetical protein